METDDQLQETSAHSTNARRGHDPSSVCLTVTWHPSKEYLTDAGTLEGANIDECIVPSRMGFDLNYLTGGGEPAAKKMKA